MTSIRKAPIVLLVALCLLAAGQAADSVAATYYVSLSGNDSNTGGSGDPWRTLQKAADSLQPGDEVRVANGTYAGFYTRRDGSAQAPIVFRADGDNVVLNSNNSSTSDIINVEGHDYTHIIGFKIENGSRAGIRVVTNTGCVVRDCTVGPNQKWAIFTAFTTDIQIIDNVCFASNEQHGIYVSNSRVADDNPVIRGNECYGNGQNGIQLNGDCYAGGDGIISGAIIEDNFVHDNGWKGFSLISVRNAIIQNNIVCNNGVAGAGAGGIHLADEPGCDNPSNDNLVVNNTLVEFDIVCMRLNNNASGNTVFNNLAVASDLSRTIVDETGVNAVDSGSNLRRTSTGGLFVDDANNDYHLAPTGDAVDAGAGSYNGRSAPGVDYEGDARPSGAGYDIGADEYGSGGGDTTPPTVAITSPSNGAVVMGTIGITADAADNVQVAGVQFEVDGIGLGSEDTAEPYEASFNTTAVSDGPVTLTARARDSAGNNAVSSPIGVTVSNGTSQSGIISTHPRLAPTAEHLSSLRAKACYDDYGNQIGACSPTSDWNRFLTWLGDGTSYYKPTAADYVLAYLVTQNSSYAQTAISKADATIADMGSERSDSFLYVYKHVKSVAIVYDVLYDQLSSAKRTAYINYMNQVMTELWNHDNNPYYTWTGWGTNQPGNNYYYSFMLATACAGLALYNENPSPPSLPFGGTTYNDIFEFFQAKINDQMIPYLNGYGKGGGWHEGVNYRLGSYMHMFEMFKVLRDAGGDDLFRTIDFAKESLYYQLYILQPGNSVLYPGGDLARESSMAVSAYDRVVMLFLADGLSGQLESQYAQYWLNHTYTSIPSGWQFLFGLEYELYQDRTERNYSELPLGYRAEGLGFVNSRSSWSSDAACVSFISTDRIESHQHFDQNSFVVYRSGWQAPDAATYSHTGIIQGTNTHNTILVDGRGQRFGVGTGDVTKYELTDTYSYAVGDASDAYYGGEYGRKDMGDPPLLTHFEREFVHYLPDFVVVFDRITPVNAGSEIKYLVHSRYQPSVDGTLVTSSQGGGKLFHKTLLPVSSNMSVVGENYGLDGARSSYRVEIKPAAPTANHIFLNVMHVAPSSASSMPVAELFSTTSDNMVGAKVDAGDSDAIFLFSTDPGGAPPEGGVIYEVGRAETIDHYLMDLMPATAYHVETLVTDNTLTVYVSEGSGPVTSQQGVLHFMTGGSAVEIATMHRDR